MPKSVGGAEGCLLGDGVKPESKGRTTLVAETAVFVSLRFINVHRTAAHPLSRLSHTAPSFFGTQPDDSLCGCSGRLGLVAV